MVFEIRIIMYMYVILTYVQVMLHRAGTEGSIVVDNSDVRSGRSGGSLSGLDVIYLPLFVGGVPRDANLKGLLAPGEVVCMHKVNIELTNV